MKPQRQLSPRVLNFTKTQMYWECDEMQASESYPYGFPEEAWANVKGKALNPYSLLDTSFEEEYAPIGTEMSPLVRRAFEVWANAVSAYTVEDSYSRLADDPQESAQNLTNPADKLVAISAIARELKPFMNCRYLAGHWETGLVRQLAWTGSNGSQRPSTYRAPSWSWASVDAPIQVFNSQYNGAFGTREVFYPLVDVLNVEVESLTDDPMGQVISGSLTLWCHLIELEVKSLLNSRYGRVGDQGNETILVNGERTCLHVQLDDEDSRPSVPWSVYCVPISLLMDRTTSDSTELNAPEMALTFEFNSILLEETKAEGIYQRVGFLGANLGQSLTKEDFAHDPILRAAGSLDFSKENTLFSPNVEGLQQIEMV